MPKNTNLDKEMNLMVALDLTQMDAKLLRYVSFMCSVIKIQNLYFFHNIKTSQLYNLYDEFLKEGLTLESIVQQALEKSIKENYKGYCPHSLVITSENYTESTLSALAKENKIDLVITGNKSELQGTGALSQKLVRMLPSSLLLIPEETKNQLNKVLVPTDFSSDSAQSFYAARRLAEKSNGEIEALHVYNIPSFYFPYINTEKAIDKTKEHILGRIQSFRTKFNLPSYILFRQIDREDQSVVEVIEEEAEKGNFDIIVVSARGSNNITSLFIGSITNELLIRNRRMPLLVIK